MKRFVRELHGFLKREKEEISFDLDFVDLALKSFAEQKHISL